MRSTHHVRVKFDGDNFKCKHGNTERYINITSLGIAEFIKRLEARMLEICKGPIQPSSMELSIHTDEESDKFSFNYKCNERPTVTRMDSNDKAVNLDIDKLQGNYFKGSCIIEFYCLECKGKGFSGIKIILNYISLNEVTLDGSDCELFNGDTNFNDGYEYESDKEGEYDHLFNKSEDEDGYSSDH